MAEWLSGWSILSLLILPYGLGLVLLLLLLLLLLVVLLVLAVWVLCSLFLSHTGGASRHDRRVGHRTTRWDVQTATRADSIRRNLARHDLDQFLRLMSASRAPDWPQ